MPYEKKKSDKKTPDAGKTKTKWFQILTDTMIPGKFPGRVIKDSADKIKKATQK